MMVRIHFTQHHERVQPPHLFLVSLQQCNLVDSQNLIQFPN